LREPSRKKTNEKKNAAAPEGEGARKSRAQRPKRRIEYSMSDREA